MPYTLLLPRARLVQRMTNAGLLAVAAIVAFLGGLGALSHANRKAAEPFAHPTSYADYLVAFLWVLGVILAVGAAIAWK